MAGVGCIAGIGFTMSLLIASLAFGGPGPLMDQARLGVLAGSALSAMIGALALAAAAPRRAMPAPIHPPGGPTR